MNKTQILQKFVETANQSSLKPFNWLEGRSHSEAYIICVGAGPWKFGRRRFIQEMALNKLDGKDLKDLDFPISFYPLKWQNDIINNTISNLNKIKFDDFCNRIKTNSSKEIREKILYLSGCKKLPKVLSLFCRDSMKVDAFPIDRHVKRALKNLNLPTNEEEIIQLCYDAGFFNIREIATCFVKESSGMENPNWSI